MSKLPVPSLKRKRFRKERFSFSTGFLFTQRLKAKKVVTGKGYYWVLKPDIKPGEIVRI
jgi:hypothetical protein